MHREWIDRSAHEDGPLQQWDPRLKVALTLVTLVVIAFGAREPSVISGLRLGALSGAGLLLAIHAGVRLRSLFLRSLVVLPFVGFVALARLIQVVPGEAAGVSVGNWTVALAPDGVEAAALILARAWLSICVSLLLVVTTPLPRILAVLERARVPRGLVETCSLVYRYLWVLLDEGGRLLLARRLRGGRVAIWRSGGAMLGTLFVRALDRGHRIEIALRLRGYRGTLPIGAAFEWTRRDTLRSCGAVSVFSLTWWGAEWIVRGGFA